MGLLIDRDRFTDEDFHRFDQRLKDCLQVFAELLGRADFGAGEPSLGAELELSLIGSEAQPLALNREIIEDTGDARLTVELDRFNLECNLCHGPLAGRPFAALRREIESALVAVRRAAAARDARAVMIGILPTLRRDDLESSAMTETPRFRALSTALQSRRSAPFRLDIHGQDPLQIECDDVTFEGAATSLQIHLRVAASQFARVYNAVQLATAPVLAASGNSPTFLGHRLWEETRVALFKQAVDDRPDAPDREGREARVSFGTGWVREGAHELFADAVADHDPLLPILSEEDPLDRLRSGGLPALEEMRLHAGTVWRWNRPVYDPAGGGHLRIEMRALPAGPSVTDMLANTAFLLGAALGLAPDMDAITGVLPFERVHHDFYRAAQHGLEARLAWPIEPGGPVETLPAGEVVEKLAGVARAGLSRFGVDPAESEPLIATVAERARSGQTGAAWQRRTLARTESRGGRREGLRRMFEAYIERSSQDRPVHTWGLGEA
ncbi:MAG: glutamate--cysteine ligase [Myxococcota bacterium]